MTMTKVLNTRFDESLDRLHTGVDINSRGKMIDQEIDYLSPFFSSMAQRNNFDASRLSKIFDYQAKRTGAVIASEFSVLPYDEFQKFSCGIGKNYASFSVDKSIRGHVLGFGFIQHYEGRRTYAIPALALSVEMAELAGRYGSDQLLDAVGKLYSLANHDYMHHLAPETVSSSIVKRHSSKRSYVNCLLHDDQDFNTNKTNGTESFFLTTHLHNFQDASRRDPLFTATYTKTCDIISSEIEKISKAILADGQGLKAEKLANEFVNYFGNVALFGMARICDITEDGVARRFADDLTRIDPLPGFKFGKSWLNPFGLTSSKDRTVKDPDKARMERMDEVLALSDRISLLTAERRAGNLPDAKKQAVIEFKFIKAVEQDIFKAFGPNALMPPSVS